MRRSRLAERSSGSGWYPGGVRRLPLLLVVVLLGTTLLAAPPAAAAGARYVALGDSYAAGLGIAPADTSANAAACGRSGANYPHRLAAALALTLVDVTCSGAVVADLQRYQSVGGASVPPQLDALTADTELVTLTVGGNDLGFSEIAGFCASLSGPDGPVQGDKAADCRSHYDAGGTDSLAAEIDGPIRTALTAALAEIHTRAPAAQIVLVGYPAIVPDAAHTPSGGCWSSPLQVADALPFTDTDLPYLEETQARLNNMLLEASGSVSGSFSTDYPDSLAHTACSSAPWVNGVQLAGLSLASRSLHPNAAGVAAVTAAATTTARSALDSGAGNRPAPLAVGDGSGSGLSGTAWAVIAVAALLVLLVGVGVFRVLRRRR